MKTKIRFIYSFIATVLICMSCDDSFLVTDPTDRIATNKFWKQEKDGILATNSCYQAFNNIFRPYLYVFEGCSDNATSTQTWLEGYMIGNGSFNSSWAFVKNTWRDCYVFIRRTNDVIAHVGEIPDADAALKNRLKGEALVIRAMAYNMLTILYGDVPFITAPVTIIDDSKLPRENKNTIVESILRDLDEAIGYLPVKYTNNEDKGRITKGAALAVKARICLYNGKYNDARNAAAEVMKPEYGYELLSDYADIFNYEHEMNEEVILDDQYMPDLRRHDVFRHMGPRSAQGLSEYVPTRALIEEYEDGDVRRDANFILPGDAHPYIDGSIFDPTPGSGTIDEAGVSYYATCTGYQFKKYVLKEDMTYIDRCHINFIMVRYADVLLMFAEAENEVNGPTEAAYNAVNRIRARARGNNSEILPDLKGLDQEQFRQAIRKERRMELAGENLRYFDILRWRIAENVLNGPVHGMDYLEPGTGENKTILVETRKFDPAKNYLWPIPESELRLNPALNGHQNPGY
jgi:hypothetical protein